MVSEFFGTTNFWWSSCFSWFCGLSVFTILAAFGIMFFACGGIGGFGTFCFWVALVFC